MSRATDFAESIKELIGSEWESYSEVERVIVARRVTALLAPLLPKPNDTTPERPMTDVESREFGTEQIPFGKFRGTPYDSVPLEYLEWLADESLVMAQNLRRYLKSRRIKGEQ